MTAELTLSWRLGDGPAAAAREPVTWPHPVTREWAWGDGRGAGARVCILDSGVEQGHPRVGPVQGAYAVQEGPDGELTVVEDTEGDVCGHGTACASIIRSLAPACEIFSVRVLGLGYFGSGEALLAGLRWALAQNFDVINMSLSTTKPEVARELYHLADVAYFRRNVIVASAHNIPIESFPWRFASVISVGSHRSPDPELLVHNPAPPVEFFARGDQVPVGWLNGGHMVCSGNSFATPHVSGMCARILGAHRGLTPYQVKTLLHLIAGHVTEGT
ncbi:S8 family serine peptidase [Streptomyces sp. NBC_00287]|uniref:S8 family peptidase n=1 Tax=Streptomyces sp. NBC_00287 TaxID=2975702 RepID=UPI002E2C3169|nr:S8 family serine peptidase [Streptomyces sp. NBC_00287]